MTCCTWTAFTALRTSGDVERLIEADDQVTARFATQAGSRSVLALPASSNEPLILPSLAAIDGHIDRSDQAWREWSGGLTYKSRHHAHRCHGGDRFASGADRGGQELRLPLRLGA